MDPKDLLLQHFEKGVLALAGIWLIVIGVGFVGEPAELSENERLVQALRDIKKHMQRAQVEEPQPPDWVPTLAKRISPEEVGTSGKFPEWVMHRRPGFLYYVQAAAVRHRPKHGPPADLQVDASERGRITLTWQRSLENEYVIITRFEIERKVGSGPWERLKTIEGLDVDPRYEDEAVQARASYNYRITSVAEIDRDNPVVLRETMVLPDGMIRRTSAETGPVKTQRDVFILPISVSQMTDQDLIKYPPGQAPPETAYVRVYKWFEGKFEDKAFNVKAGQTIGKKVKIRRREVDFSTGAVLLDVEIRKRKHPKYGHEEQVQWIKYRFDDGTTEESNDKDKPAEMGGD